MDTYKSYYYVVYLVLNLFTSNIMLFSYHYEYQIIFKNLNLYIFTVYLVLNAQSYFYLLFPLKASCIKQNKIDNQTVQFNMKYTLRLREY